MPRSTETTGDDFEVEGTPSSKFEGVAGRRLKAAPLIVVVAGALVLFFGGGWYVATAFESPSQKAAAARPPAAGTVTAQVTKGDLSQTISAATTMTRSTAESVSIADADAGEVVTARPASPGDSVGPGSSVLELNGRPLIAIPGRFPFYRDLAEGDIGPDVKQLQSGLVASGFATTADGVFGPTTTAAVRALYARLGYAAPAQTSASTSSSEVPDEASDPSSDGAAGVTGNPVAAPVATATSKSGETHPTKTDIVVPRSEFAVFAVLPSYLRAVPAVGATVGGQAVVGLQGGAVVGSAGVAANVSTGLQPGMSATVTGPKGALISASVKKIVEPSHDGDDAAVILEPRRGTFPDSWLGMNALAVITLAQGSKDALIVPTNAIVTGGRGPSYLLREDAQGDFSEVPIHEISSLSGRSAVEPVEPSALAAGDQVKVG